MATNSQLKNSPVGSVRVPVKVPTLAQDKISGLDKMMVESNIGFKTSRHDGLDPVNVFGVVGDGH
jgi:hypothetical protein